MTAAMRQRKADTKRLSRAIEIAKLRQSGRGGVHDDTPRQKIRRDRQDTRRAMREERHAFER